IKFIVLLLLLINCNLPIYSQHTVLRGNVTDENNEPFPHVNIFLSTSKTGTVTNNNGAFSLTFNGKEDVLNASFIGYETHTVKVNNKTGFVKIQLKPSPLQLNEVVVTNLSAPALLKKAIEKIPENYLQEPFLSKAYYRAKLSEKDTLRYLEETFFNIVKSYQPGFSDEYFLVKNRNFRLATDHQALRQIGNFDMVKSASRLFNSQFFRNYTVKFLPSTTFDNRMVYALSYARKNKEAGSFGSIYIDVEDMAFVRFDLHFESGDKRVAQYKKIEDKYYLMSGYTLHLNKRFDRVLPAEADILVTNIVHAFTKENIEGTRVNTEDILETYATQAQDTLFWQEHNAILPDSAILKALEKYQAKQKDSIIIRNSEQYKAHIKRLYTPNLSLMASTGLTRDFSTFNHNTNSINRYVSHLLQRNLRGTLKQQIGIYLYQTLVSIPLEENASEWLLLNKNGIHSKINPLIVNKYNSTYLFGIADRQISDFKTGNHLDFMRLHTIRNDGHYAKSVLIEEELAKADLSNKNNWFNYLQLYSMELLMHKGTNTYNPFKKDVKQHDITEEKQPLIIDRNRSWVKYLFNPDAEYQRHILNENLSDEEQRYLKRSAYWSWLNLVSPQLYGIPKFKLNEKNSFTFSLNYLRTPFGEMFAQNIWLMHNYSQLHGIFVKQYRNYEKTTFGIGYKLYDVSLLGTLYSTTSFDIWQQPTGFKFKTNNTFTGFYINQLFEYQLLPHKYIDRNNLSIFVGLDYKTKGYVPESFYTDKNFNIKAGLKMNLW
ncbi:MAG: carboxypeptidase-like regulatory domain-containing protein, partial [Bacteroidia bacterium]|nr:carboxypeptidase-like regulatory domain-containing protein [Bacteroidia bacterium]